MDAKRSSDVNKQLSSSVGILAICIVEPSLATNLSDRLIQ